MASKDIRNCKEYFVQRARSIHGDKYDYSKVQYIDISHKITIICPIHGEFEQVARNHLKGCGCPKCGQELSAKKRTMTQEEFIEKARRTHGDKYDYSQTKFETVNKKIKIICPKHGEFTQNACAHLYGHGCPKCGFEIHGSKPTTDHKIHLGIDESGRIFAGRTKIDSEGNVYFSNIKDDVTKDFFNIFFKVCDDSGNHEFDVDGDKFRIHIEYSGDSAKND